MLTKSHRTRKSISPKLRFETLHRFGFACAYCGVSAQEAKLEVDHLVPVAQGGAHSPENFVAACEVCNAGKSDLSIRNLPPLAPLSRKKDVPPLVIPEGDQEWEREEAIAANLVRFIERRTK